MRARGSLVLSLAGALLCACNPPPAAPAAAAGRGDLRFADADAFDTSLAAALSNNSHEVHLAVAATLGNVPGRLNAWLAEVQSAGGTVRAFDPAAADGTPHRRGVGSNKQIDTVDDDLTVRQWEDRAKLLRTADNYDVNIIFDARIGQIRELVFVRKP